MKAALQNQVICFPHCNVQIIYKYWDGFIYIVLILAFECPLLTINIYCTIAVCLYFQGRMLLQQIARLDAWV